MNDWVKMGLAGVGVASWTALVIAGKADVAPLVQFLQLGLTGLAAHGLTMVNPAGKSGDTGSK